MAVFTLAAVTFAQFLALSHEMTVRHFRCPEHGELTHVATSVSGPQPGANLLSTSAVRTQVGQTQASHEHCATAFVVEGGSAAPVVRVPVRYTPPPKVVRAVPIRARRIGRAFVLASAPKTSPPSV